MSPAQEALLLKTEVELPRIMTAPALNAANPVAVLVGAKPSGAPNGAAGEPLAGFDALLAALFPQADPSAVIPATPTGKGDPLAAGAETDGKADTAAGEPASSAPVAADAALDPNAALAAALVVPPTAVVEATATTTAGDPASAPRPARPAFPPILRANLPAAAPGKGEPALQAADDEAAADELASLEAPRQASDAAAKTDARPVPPAWGRDKAAGQPAAPALANAGPKADLPQKFDTAAPEAPAPDAPPAPTPAPPETAAPIVAAGLAARPEPLAGPAKPGKAERGKTTPDGLAASDVKGPALADKAATARAVIGAAGAAQTQAEAKAPDVEAAPAAETAADAPEFTPSAEARATNASSAPAHQAAHAVRGSPETVANLSAQIIKKLEGQSTRFDVELDPQGLGKVNVRIDIGAHGAITAAMSFDNPQAAAELRSRAAELQRTLEQAGFNLSGGVTFDVSQDRGHHGQARQDQTDNNSGRALRGQAFRAALDTAGDAANAADGGALRLRRGVTAGLDMRI